MAKKFIIDKKIYFIIIVYNIMFVIILFNIFKFIVFIKTIFKYQFDIILLGIIIEL